MGDTRRINWSDGMAKMAPSVLLLSALLALSSASLQDIVKRNVVKRNIHSQGDVGPGLFGHNENLEWKWWGGHMPSDAVTIENKYAGRTEWICMYDCEAGFYHPDLGPYCHYPYGNREYKGTGFYVLVNKDNFEVLEWKEGFWGIVPSHMVQTCPGAGVYVGKNKYGLGKVVPRHQAFFLPWRGKEYFYKSYQVLVINRDTYQQEISDVEYAIDKAVTVENAPEIMTKSSITNNECQAVKKIATHSMTTQVQSTWNIGRSTRAGTISTISAQIPFNKLYVWHMVHSCEGSTVTMTTTHLVSVQVNIPPNHSCDVRVEGRKMKADIPYTAILSRRYNSVQIRSTYISGTYNGVQMNEVQAVVGRCEPVANPKPCP